MSIITVKEQRDVVPNWRSFKKTAILGELVSTPKVYSPAPIYPITPYLLAWRENKTIAYASDLLSASVVNGDNTSLEIAEAARYILDSDISSEPMKKLASSVLISNVPREHLKSSNTQETLNNLFNKEERNKELIRFIRHENAKFPYNPIAYCELARCYTLLGANSQAEKAMRTALHLAPTSIYITRCAARMYIQIGDIAAAHKIVTRNPAIREDPWLIASEIALNSSIGRNSRFAKKGIQVLKSGKFSPFTCSELASAIGTLEMANGKRKKSIEYLNLSLYDPNDNSLAQAEWMKTEHNDLRLNFRDYSSLLLKSEAEARYAFNCRRYDDALVESIKWIDDLPYDKTPILFSSSVAHTFLKDYETASKILRIGLIANPGDSMLTNNLAYVLALNGEVDEAESLMSNPHLYDASTPIDSLVCHIATKGLIEFRKKHSDEGRRLYTEAINLANERCDDKTLVRKAILNYLREEIIANGCATSDIEPIITQINPGNDREMCQLQTDVISEMEKQKQRQNLLQIPSFDITSVKSKI